MLIVLDGHPGAGKTTLLRHVERRLPVGVIGEVLAGDGAVVPDYGRYEQPPSETLAKMPMIFRSDLLKHRRAAVARKQGLAIMDRNYVYTLAVSLAIGISLDADAFVQATRWFQRHRAELEPPDAYVLLVIPSELSNERTGWRPYLGNPMSEVHFRRIASAYSDAFRRTVEPWVPVFEIDATKSVDSVVKDALRILDDARDGDCALDR